ncbi:MAG: hydrogenase maturation protease [Dehalococcoidia bacterium]|nr:hydrogenase maturation protease [Dehalococcoidia bacterium]
MKTLILGLGNPILGDDGIGLRVTESLRARLSGRDITVSESNASGLTLLDLLVGYDRAIIIDAIQTEDGDIGEVYRLEVSDLNVTRHAASPHDVNLATALELGKRLNLALPQQISIIAIEIPSACTFTEECSPEVEKAIPLAVRMTLAILDEEYRNPL